MKIFSSAQIKQIDEFTIAHEPVASTDLMERAAGKLFSWYIAHFDRSDPVCIFAGPGNNGGDGLALARLLYSSHYEVSVWKLRISGKQSPEFLSNSRRLDDETSVGARELSDADQFPLLASGTIIIDAIFGSGLTRPAEGLAASVIRLINNSGCKVISIDLPSGLFSEDNTGNAGGEIVRAKHTLTFQFPKLSFMFSENEQFIGSWTVLPIGLHPAAIASQPSLYSYTLADAVLPLLRTRNKFAHKGSFGHGLLVAGSEGKTGACILGAAAALRSGIGLITCHTPSGGMASIYAALPEAMVIPDRSEKCISVALAATGFSAVAAGPGLGQAPETARALSGLLTVCDKPMVIDADALNILSVNKDWLDLLKPGTILTPHPGEFDRLAGNRDNGYSGMMKQVEFSRKYRCIVILKGAFTSISSPDGRVRFNSTGNPGMATAGSGDVLTGILLSLLSQGLDPVDAALTGVYLHGLAGDIAAEESGYESIIASDIINCLGKAFNRLRQTTI